MPNKNMKIWETLSITNPEERTSALLGLIGSDALTQEAYNAVNNMNELIAQGERTGYSYENMLTNPRSPNYILQDVIDVYKSKIKDASFKDLEGRYKKIKIKPPNIFEFITERMSPEEVAKGTKTLELLGIKDVEKQSDLFADKTQVENARDIAIDLALKSIERKQAAGLTRAEIIANITDAALSSAQVQTLVTTSLNNYSRAVTSAIMEDEPNDTLYQYIGPIDGRTRDICLEMGSSPLLTQDEIVKNFGADVLVYGGGYNCRHKWQSTSKIGVPKSMFNPKKAKELLDAD